MNCGNNTRRQKYVCSVTYQGYVDKCTSKIRLALPLRYSKVHRLRVKRSISMTSPYEITCQQDLRLIKLIQQHPCLWNTNLEQYKISELRADAWEYITEKCGLANRKTMFIFINVIIVLIITIDLFKSRLDLLNNLGLIQRLTGRKCLQSLVRILYKMSVQ